MYININITHDNETGTLTLTTTDGAHEIVLECLSEVEVNRISIGELKDLFASFETI